MVTEAFDVDAYVAEAKLTPLPIKIGRKTHTLPHFGTLSLDQAEKIDAGRVRDVLVELLGEDEAAAFTAIPGVALNEFLRRWISQSETESGEDEASSSS